MSGAEAPLIGAALGETAAIANPFTEAMVTGIGTGASGFPVNSAIGSNALLGSEALGGAWQDIQAADKWATEHPMLTQFGMKTASSLMQPHQMRPMGGGGQISRGQIPQMDFSSLLNPQQNTVLRPQAMSLL